LGFASFRPCFLQPLNIFEIKFQVISKSKRQDLSFAVVLYGLLGLGVAYLASLMDRILTVALKMFGIVGGPVLGMFFLGLFTPVGNSLVSFTVSF